MGVRPPRLRLDLPRVDKDLVTTFPDLGIRQHVLTWPQGPQSRTFRAWFRATQNNLLKRKESVPADQQTLMITPSSVALEPLLLSHSPKLRAATGER